MCVVNELRSETRLVIFIRYVVKEGVWRKVFDCGGEEV